MGSKLYISIFFCFALFVGYGQEQNFIVYKPQNGLISSTVTCFYQDQSGLLWIGTDVGVSLFNGSEFKSYNQFSGLHNSPVKQIAQDKDNKIWILHVNGKVTIGEKDVFKPYKQENNNVSNLLNIDGEIQCITNNKGEISAAEVKFQLSNQDKTFQGLNSKDSVLFEHSFKEKILNYFLFKNVVFIQFNNQLHKYSTLKDKLNLIQTYASPLFKEMELNTVFVDEEQTLWLGTEYKGVLALYKENFPIYSFAKEELKNNSFIQNKQYLIYEQSVLELQPNLEVKQIYKHTNSSLNAYYKTKNNDQWIGDESGLSVRLAGTSIVYSFIELKNKKVTFIAPLEDNMLIIADNTLYLYLSNENKIVDYFSHFKTESSRIYSIYQLENELYALGVGNVYRVSAKGANALFKATDVRVKEITFTSIAKDADTFILGTKEKNSLTYFNENTYAFNTAIYGTLQQNIQAVLVNQSTNWYATSTGLVKHDKKQNRSYTFNQVYLSSIDFLYAQPLKIKDKLYFMDKKGLVEVDPNLFLTKTLPKTILSSIELDGKQVAFNSRKSLTIPYENQKIVFTLKTRSLKNTEIYFQYRLIGLEEKWSPVSTQKNISYTKLSPGNYTFEVRTVDPYNNLFGPITSSTIFIDIPWYKSSRVILGGIFMLLFFISLMYALRVMRLKKQEKRLQEEVNKKTFQLSLQNNKLEQFSYSLSHDLKNPIHNIKGLIEIMDEESKSPILPMLKDSAQQLEDKIQRTLQAIKQTQLNANDIDKINLKDLLHRVKKNLLFQINESKAIISFHSDINYLYDNESLIESVFYNLLSNSIKYKKDNEAPKIDIEIKAMGEQVLIQWKDNGIGIDVEKEKDQLFSIFKRIETSKEGTGIGLYMIKQMIELNGGSIDVKSNLGEGTTFFVTLKRLRSK